MSDYRKELLGLFDKLAAKSGLTLSYIGYKAANDGKFYDRISHGGGCTVDTYQNVKTYLESQLTDSQGAA